MSVERSSTICAISAARPPESKKKSERRRLRAALARMAACGRGCVVRARVALSLGSRPVAASVVVAAALALGGCTSLVGSLAADTLSAAILDQDDPAL